MENAVPSESKCMLQIRDPSGFQAPPIFQRRAGNRARTLSWISSRAASLMFIVQEQCRKHGSSHPTTARNAEGKKGKLNGGSVLMHFDRDQGQQGTAYSSLIVLFLNFSTAVPRRAVLVLPPDDTQWYVVHSEGEDHPSLENARTPSMHALARRKEGLDAPVAKEARQKRCCFDRRKLTPYAGARTCGVLVICRGRRYAGRCTHRC